MPVCQQSQLFANTRQHLTVTDAKMPATSNTFRQTSTGMDCLDIQQQI